MADGAGCDAPQRGKLEMTGDVGDYQSGVVDDPVHDPTLFADGETFYVFSTGRLDPLRPGRHLRSPVHLQPRRSVGVDGFDCTARVDSRL